MKQLIKLIIVYIIVLFVLAETAIILESDKRNISNLTAENAALQQDIEQLTKEIAQLKAQQTKEPEVQKISRSADRPRYNLTEAERDLVERVVMAESGGEPYEGQMLVAQCILNACEIDGIRPAEAIKRYAYAKARPEPSDSVKRAVSAVFDRGEEITDKPIVYFYAPERVKSKFHESQIYVLTVGGHKFFCERK